MDVSAVRRMSNGDFMTHRKLSESISFNETAFLSATPFQFGDVKIWDVMNEIFNKPHSENWSD